MWKLKKFKRKCLLCQQFCSSVLDIFPTGYLEWMLIAHLPHITANSAHCWRWEVPLIGLRLWVRLWATDWRNLFPGTRYSPWMSRSWVERMRCEEEECCCVVHPQKGADHRCGTRDWNEVNSKVRLAWEIICRLIEELRVFIKYIHLSIERSFPLLVKIFYLLI